MSVGRQFENGVLSANHASPLPHEMMVEIFLHCVESDELSDCEPSSTSPPLTLTWVCQYWRRLAISLPNLWTSISLGEKGTDPVDDARLLDLWIQRSGPTKRMNISLCHEMKDAERPVFFDPNRGERYLVGMKALSDKLLSISHRWQTLDLHALDLYVLDPILRALVTAGAPHLETLSISTKYFDFFGSVHFLDLTNCPTLRSMRLLCPMLCPTGKSTVASNMTNLEIRYCPLMRDCMTWLTICPNLERLSIRFFKALSSSLPRDKGPLTLPRLKYLAISCFSDDSDPGPLLDILVLPTLCDLTLDMNGLVHSEFDYAWSDQMLGLIKRSSAPLERLTMIGTPMTSDGLIRLLESTPQVKKLVLSGSVISDKVLESMAVNLRMLATEEMMQGNDSGDIMTFSLCPSLESLELREFQCTPNALISLIYARCRTGSGFARLCNAQPTYNYSGLVENCGSLRNLTLVWDPHPTLLDHPLIQECIVGGLEITNQAWDPEELLKESAIMESYAIETD